MKRFLYFEKSGANATTLCFSLILSKTVTNRGILCMSRKHATLTHVLILKDVEIVFLVFRREELQQNGGVLLISTENASRT